MSPRASILHISTGAELGGAERVLLDLVCSLDRERFLPWVIVPREGRLAEALRTAGISTIVLDYLGRARRLGRYSSWREYVGALRALPHIAGRIRDVGRLMNRAEIGLVHAHGIKAQVFTSGLAPWVRARFVWHAHDFVRHRGFWWGFQWLGRLVPDAIVAPSDAVAREFPNRANVFTIPHGVDLRAFAPALGEPVLRPRRVGLIGVLAPWKGQHVFIQAAERVSQSLPDVEFLLVGDEIYDTAGHRGFREELEREIVRRGLQQRVRLLGFHVEIARILQGLDLVVHCSLEPEPFGRVLIEAMACGKPVIASRGGATEEIVRDGETGILVPAGDAVRLAEAMLALLGDPLRCARLGRAARERVERFFSLQAHVRKIEELYDMLLSGGRRRARCSSAITSSSETSRKSS